MLREGGPPPQDGEARTRHRRRLIPRRHEAGEPAGGEKIVHPALHTVARPCLSVPRRELQATVLPEDEASGPAHEDLQAEDERGLSHMQAAYRAVLLSREALPGDEVLGAVLQQHKAEAEAAAGAAARAAAAAAAAAHGGHEHARLRARPRLAPHPQRRARLAAPLQARFRLTHAAAQRAEGAATGIFYFYISIFIIFIIFCNSRCKNYLITAYKHLILLSLISIHSHSPACRSSNCP